jgi:uncharacterized protein (DUF1501 family)
MQRRKILASSLLLPLTWGHAQLHAAGSASGGRFLLVFLRGGYDAASLLVPVSSSFYYASRPDIAIARPSDDLASALPLNSDWGLHPALRETLYPLYKSGELAFVPFAGTEDRSRSHFETQDSMERGLPQGAHGNFNSGFLNRLAATVKGSSAMAFTDQLPTIFQGTVNVPNTGLKSIAKPSVDARQSDIIASMYRGTPLAATVQEGFTVRAEVMRELAAEMDAASRNAISSKGFELEARRIAKLMREDYQLGFVDVGGWDTHVGQGAATGYLASRLDELGHGLAAFAQEMGAAWKDTTVLVISEFGRTFRQNGNRGTDHGHGSVYWVMGGSVRGGRIAGEQVAVDRANLLEDRDYQVRNEYRALIGGLLQRQYGLSPAQLEQVFPGARPQDLGLL